MNILYLTSRLPVPPLVKGDTLRDFYIIKELASRGHQVNLVSFYRRDEANHPNMEHIKQYCQTIRLVKFDLSKQSVHLVQGAFSSKPFQVLLYNSKAFQKEIDTLMSQERFDVAYAHFARLAHFLKGNTVPKVIDFQDSFEKNMMDRSLKEKNPVTKAVALIEAKRMRTYEKHTSQDFSYATVVSERDLNPELHNMVVVPNGVQDLKALHVRNKQANGLLFMGNMSYFPNEDAALFLIKDVMPILTKNIPGVKLYIVGNKPGRKLRKFASGNVIVTGFVPTMDPYFMAARIAVAPLRFGTGIQNKVLDAMKVGIPQIVSHRAAQGFERIKEELLICECNKKAFADAIIQLWDDFQLQEKLIRQGQEYVQNTYSWDRSVSLLERLFRLSAEEYTGIVTAL